jgi:hypothetical protein
MRFQVSDGKVFLEDATLLILTREQFQALEPAAVLPPSDAVEFWSEDRHYLQDPDQRDGSEYGDRSVYVAKIAQYEAAIAPPPAPLPPPLPDWEALKTALRGSPLFAKAFSTGNQNAWALLLGTLNSNSAADDAGRLADFQFAIQMIRRGLATDYTPEQIQHFNALLTAAHFSLQIP